MVRLVYDHQLSELLSTPIGLSTFLSHHNVFIIPVVNIDGFYEISNYWETKGVLESIRKNLDSEESSKKCQSREDLGIDLNRNYDFAFGNDEDGSNSDPCADDYRGTRPFSEAATRQIRNFIERTVQGQSVKIALNLHAWGNLLVQPWSFSREKITALTHVPGSNRDLRKFMCFESRNGKQLYYAKTDKGCQITPKTKFVDLERAFSFYKDIVQNAGLPEGFVVGNGLAVVDYPANGEASDWMLGRHGIYALSPELGIKDKAAENFFISSRKTLRQVVAQNYPWMEYTMMTLLNPVHLQVINVYEPVRSSLEVSKVLLSLKL